MLSKKLMFSNKKTLIGSFKIYCKILTNKHKKRGVECFRAIKFSFSNKNEIYVFSNNNNKNITDKKFEYFVITK